MSEAATSGAGAGPAENAAPDVPDKSDDRSQGRRVIVVLKRVGHDCMRYCVSSCSGVVSDGFIGCGGVCSLLVTIYFSQFYKQHESYCSTVQQTMVCADCVVLCTLYTIHCVCNNVLANTCVADIVSRFLPPIKGKTRVS